MNSSESEVTKVTCFNLLGTMKCFLISIGGKKFEQRTENSMSVRSDISTNTELEVGRLGSEFNSQNITDASTESLGRPTFPSSSQRQSDLKAFQFHELKTATRNFSHSTMLGEGGFGCVYKGMIKSLENPTLKLDIAVKKLGTRGLQGHKQWVTEVNVLGVVSHPNLVKLVGYCAEDDERGIQRLLVYEYMPNGSVEHHLSHKSETTLPWALRLKIAQEAAQGLTYLHEGMDFEIIFRDFKSSNILLDENWNAKLSDFGLARLGPLDGASHVSTANCVVVHYRMRNELLVYLTTSDNLLANLTNLTTDLIIGTLGYAAPEYIQTGRLTSKHDVWSFGVFLYELLTGRLPIDKNRPKNEQKLLDWVKPHLSDAKKFQMILDPRFEGKCPLRSAQKLAIVANRCLSRNYRSRPKMSEVLEMLNPIVEAAAETGSCQPMARVLPSEIPRDAKAQKKRRIPDSKTGERGWFSRLWTPKLVKTF